MDGTGSSKFAGSQGKYINHQTSANKSYRLILPHRYFRSEPFRACLEATPHGGLIDDFKTW
jgi:hypothetical protein